MDNQQPQIEAQGLFDVFKLFNRENIDKVNKILDSITIEELENGATRISIEVAPDAKAQGTN